MKTYQVTKEIKDLFTEEILLIDCRDSAIAKDLSYEIVMKYSRLCMEKHKEAWSAVRSHLPELDGYEDLAYNGKTCEVEVHE